MLLFFRVYKCHRYSILQLSFGRSVGLLVATQAISAAPSRIGKDRKIGKASKTRKTNKTTRPASIR
jgi:hypothetical protein